MPKQKNSLQFIIITVITFVILIMFILAIRYFVSIDSKTYSIDENSYTYDTQNNFVEISSQAKLKMGFDGDYKLVLTNNLMQETYNLGSHAVINNSSSSDLSLYGTYYEVLSDGSVKRISKENKISKINGAKFYKISDRKYLIIDKKISSSDSSINTKDYLIVEIDKNGNSTLYNDYINVKEINPLVINTSSYDFDIANEKLGINDNVINLKKIIGSSNMYEAPKDSEETPDGISDELINSTTDYLKKQTENLRKQVEAQNDYYNQYFKTVVNTFNNLNSSLQDTNKKQYDIQVDQNTMKGNIKNYTLLKWLSIGVLEPGVSTIKVNYNVFDPNNEFETVYLDVSGGNIVNKNRIYLNKEQNNTTIRDLMSNTSYTLTLGYTTTINDTKSEIVEDVITIKTLEPSYDLKITKVTSKGIYYYFKMDKELRFDSAILNLYSDSNNLATINVDINNALDGYESFIPVTNLGYKVELKLEQVYYNGSVVDLDVYAKFLNADD